MAYPLTETYKIQMYGGDEPQEITRTIIVDCWSDVSTVKSYIDKVAKLSDEYEKLRKKY